MKNDRCGGAEYCAAGFCEQSLDELAERLSSYYEREIESIDWSRGSERVVLCDPATENDYEYGVEVRPLCWVLTHRASPGDRGRAAKHMNWDLNDPNAKTFTGRREELEDHLRKRGAVRIDLGDKGSSLTAHYDEDFLLPNFEIWEARY